MLLNEPFFMTGSRNFSMKHVTKNGNISNGTYILYGTVTKFPKSAGSYTSMREKLG